jgi:hypothetical protein
MTVVHAETVYQIAAILAVATSLTALASPSFAFTAETTVYWRCIPPVQLRNPGHRPDHRLHAQKPLPP